MPKRLDFNRLCAALRDLNLDQAKQLQTELRSLIQELEQQLATPESVETKGREVVEVQRMGDRLYQLERVRCGKAGCKCAGKDGELHGPYWYAYWRDNGKLKSRYVSKQLRRIK